MSSAGVEMAEAGAAAANAAAEGAAQAAAGAQAQAAGAVQAAQQQLGDMHRGLQGAVAGAVPGTSMFDMVPSAAGVVPGGAGALPSAVMSPGTVPPAGLAGQMAMVKSPSFGALDIESAGDATRSAMAIHHQAVQEQNKTKKKARFEETNARNFGNLSAIDYSASFRHFGPPPNILPNAAEFKHTKSQVGCFGRIGNCLMGVSPRLDNGAEIVILSMDLQEVQKQWLLSRWIPLLKRHSVKANWALRSYRAIGLIKTLGGVLIPVTVSFMQSGNNIGFYTNLTIIISLINTVATALEDFFDFGVRSAARRTAANTMEKLFWEFQALSGRYKGFTNQVDAFSQFVEDTEKVTFHAEEIYVRTIKESASGDDDSGGDEAKGGGKGKNNER